VELATPWFIGAAMGLAVLTTFSVGQRSFMVGAVRVEPDSELDGIRMFEMSTQTRVFAITRDGAPVRLHPRRDSRLAAGDTAYIVGRYRELLDMLRKGQHVPLPSAVPGERSREEPDGGVGSAKTG
jgi:Trk K+ transport system NAD-binding subunit